VEQSRESKRLEEYMNTETVAAHTEETTRSTIGTRKVRFFLLNPYAEHVYVAGSFNNWNPTVTPLIKEGRQLWTRELELPFGRYEYQFVIDDRWKPDGASKETVFNPFGGLNSVITVGPTNGNERN
jgi:1,4-alpha-glucan branching enzyme